jgi:endonuclease YncB( thermonuclease family)
MDQLMGGRPRCEEQDTDRYGRAIAACYVRGEDVEAWIVLNGWAQAFCSWSLRVASFEAFMSSYRERVKNGSLSALN